MLPLLYDRLLAAAQHLYEVDGSRWADAKDRERATYVDLARQIHGILTPTETAQAALAAAAPSEYESELFAVAAEDLLASAVRAGIHATIVINGIRELRKTILNPAPAALAAVPAKCIPAGRPVITLEGNES